MTKLTIYGDFNCPFSALASTRVDVLLAAGQEWRAVQHDTFLPAAGEAVVGDVAEELASELPLTRRRCARSSSRVPVRAVR